MSEPNIILTRIDNRLVHGQVGNIWVSSTGCNLIVVADDEAATNPIQQSLMHMTAQAAQVGIRFFTLQKTIDVIKKASPSQHIFIIAKTPKSVRILMEGGVPIKKVNVGNMHATDGKRMYHERHVYVDENDLNDLFKIEELGAEVFLQFSPDEKKYSLH